MIASPIDSRVFLVNTHKELDLLSPMIKENKFIHILHNPYITFHGTCNSYICDTCDLLSCTGNDLIEESSFLDTYFPTIHSDYPELFI